MSLAILEAKLEMARGEGQRVGSIGHLQRGRVALAQGDWKNALAHFQAASQQDPSCVPALTGVASMLRRLGRTDEASEWFSRALAQVPDHVPALLALASLARARGDDQDARAFAKQALAVAPKHPAAIRAARIPRRMPETSDWRSQIDNAFHMLESPRADATERLDACEVLISHGLVAAADPTLVNLHKEHRRARELRLQARQLLRLGVDGRAAGEVKGYFEKIVDGAETLVLVFGAQQSWDWVRLLHEALRPAGVSAIYLRDPDRMMFFTGVVGLGSSMTESIGALRERIDKLRPRRLLAIGNSMGSAAATRYGLALGAEAVLTIAHRADVPADAQLSHRALAVKRSLPPATQPFLRSVGDLYRAAARPPRLTVIHGEKCAAGVRDVRALAGVASLTVVPIAGGEHRCMHALISAGLLAPILQGFVATGTLDPQLQEQVKNVRRAAQRNE